MEFIEAYQSIFELLNEQFNLSSILSQYSNDLLVLFNSFLKIFFGNRVILVQIDWTTE
jgi:hypothetical protein